MFILTRVAFIQVQFNDMKFGKIYKIWLSLSKDIDYHRHRRRRLGVKHSCSTWVVEDDRLTDIFAR